jgi:2-dehydro-3-deoxyphosphooctonate aldolase (KDO 8-P synthase)
MSIPFTLIAGPCVLESPELAFELAVKLKAMSDRLGIRYLFKTSFDKANRSSGASFRGPGLEQGLQVLAQLKQELGLQVLTDIHESHQAAVVGQVVDVLQIPAFLCRQTDLLLAAAAAVQDPTAAVTAVNVKKGQFLAPWDMAQVVTKLRAAGLQGDEQLWLTERGTSFGYNTLVVDMRSLPQLRQQGCPVIFDATHSVQHRWTARVRRSVGACSHGRGGGWPVYRDPPRPRSGPQRWTQHGAVASPRTIA